MDDAVKRWRKEGKHLPAFMRDFHDQKELFKTIHEQCVTDENAPSWMNAHVYTVDAFLWFMARHGWVLTKSKGKMQFDDLEATLAASFTDRQDRAAEVLRLLMSQK